MTAPIHPASQSSRGAAVGSAAGAWARATARALFVTDLDGTLIDGQRQLPEGNRSAIEEAIASDIVVAIVTGRNMRSLLAEGAIADLPVRLASSNGAVVLAPDNRTVEWVNDLEWPLVDRVADWVVLRGHRAFIITAPGSSTTECFVRSDSAGWRAAVSPYRLDECELVEQELVRGSRPVHLAFELPSRREAERLNALLIPLLGGDASSLVVASPFGEGALLEIVPRGGKGNAVRYLASKLKVPVHATASIGDELNDVELLEATGHRFAVGGSVLSAALPGATAVSGPGTNGVADALHWFQRRLGIRPVNRMRRVS